MSNGTAIVWLRRDLRTTANPALDYAIGQGCRVVPVYIHAPEEEKPWSPGAASNWWLHNSLTNLAQSFARAGLELVIRTGRAEEELERLVAETEAGLVTWNRLYDPQTLERDRQIKRTLNESIEVKTFNGYLIKEPWANLKVDDSPYRVYTPFSKQYFDGPDSTIDISREFPAGTSTISKKLESVAVEQLKLLPNVQWHTKLGRYWKPGEAGALSSLELFLDTAVANYGTDRDVPGVDGISRLSPHLHFGEISPHQVWTAVQLEAELLMVDGNDAAMSNCRDYLKQLVWRDFAHHILFHYPHTQQQPFNKRFESFPWDDNQGFLEAWQQGRTGIPLVDAGMRELWETGWMHNRVRMIAASLLTKNGLVHWLEGARWFWDTLVDANLANNSMGWQWVAGCGVDAAPYFRIFSPSRQGERFDPLGEYVKRWIPELAGLGPKHLHDPSGAPDSVLSAAGIRLDESYPRAIVDLSASRKTALELYKSLA